jgi:hypothetical protein
VFAALRFWLSPARRRFMRRAGHPALARFTARLGQAGSRRAIGFISTLLQANLDFLAYALSPGGPLAAHAADATPERVEAALGSALLFSVNLFVRDEIRKNESDLIPLLAAVAGWGPKKVMLRRDNLRKAPHSEEWMLYTQLVADLGGERPKYAPELERSFGYNYLSYIGQYRPVLERELARPE